MTARRREDIEAVARLGAEGLHLGLAEAPYRHGDDGAPFYTELSRLFGPPDPADARVLLAVLAERLRTLPATERLVAPLAVGGHVDHRLVRDAVEASGRPARFYEEFPYAEWKWLALRRALERPREWRCETLPLPERLFEAKVGAILAYESQVPAMFRSEARLRKQLRRHLRRAGGERLWAREETR
jgi:LmbE family N-acetylglucosaminyl deacetylase